MQIDQETAGTAGHVCGDPHAIDAAWMTAALEDAGVARGATITELHLDRFVGTGQMGRTARYRLAWDQPEGRPASVIGKFPTDDPTARTNAFDNGSYLKEWLFYSELNRTVHVRTPDVWVARFDDPGRDFVLIMEDLHGSEQGDQFRGLTVDEARLAMSEAAALHAPRWGDDSLLGLLGTTPEEAAAMLAAYYGAMVEPALARLGAGLADDEIQITRDLASFIARWTMGTESPRTLVHMDFRPDNFLFGVDEGAPPLVVVDWQTISFGLAMNDVAYMIGGAFEPAERAVVEQDLVAHYRAELATRGVDYDAETCWRDYRFASVWGVIMSVIAAVLAQQTERGDAMLTTMLRRAARHALDCDALSLLR